MSETQDFDEVAADYGNLTRFAFDAKYPGWKDDESFQQRLREAFARMEPSERPWRREKLRSTAP